MDAVNLTSTTVVNDEQWQFLSIFSFQRIIFELKQVHVVGLDVYQMHIRLIRINTNTKKNLKKSKNFFLFENGRVVKRVVVMLESGYFSFLFIVFCGLRSHIDYLLFFARSVMPPLKRGLNSIFSTDGKRSNVVGTTRVQPELMRKTKIRLVLTVFQVVRHNFIKN